MAFLPFTQVGRVGNLRSVILLGLVLLSVDHIVAKLDRTFGLRVLLVE